VRLLCDWFRRQKREERDTLAEILARPRYASGGVIKSDVPNNIIAAMNSDPFAPYRLPCSVERHEHGAEMHTFHWPPAPEATSVSFAVPTFTTASGESIMTTFPVPAEVTTHVPLDFKSAWGAKVTGPSTGSVSSSNPAAVTVALSADGQSVALTSPAPGGATITYTDGNLSASLTVEGVAPSAASVAFDTLVTTSEALPAPAVAEPVAAVVEPEPAPAA
jgi:hypothetical protein